MPFLKYGAIAVSVFLFALALRYIPYIEPIQALLPLSPEAFDRLGEPPTKNFEDQPGAPIVVSRDAIFDRLGFPSPSIGAPTSESLEEAGYVNRPVSKSIFDRFSNPGLAESPNKESVQIAAGNSLPSRIFGRSDNSGLAGSPTKGFELAQNEDVESLPMPKLLPPPPPPVAISPISIPTTSEVNKIVERIVERVVIREVPVYITQPAPAPAPVAKPAPAPQSTALASACSIQTFENAAGGSSHTLIFRCEGYDQCSIARNGESFIDVSGKGYFNFPGTPPSNYKIRCDDISRVWSASVTPVATKPLYDQVGFRWFANDDVEIGVNPLAGINEMVRFKDTRNDPFRLRLAILAGRSQVSRGDAKFKLQVAFSTPTVPLNPSTVNAGILCNQIPDAEYKDVSLAEDILFFNNPSLDDKQLMAPSIDDPFYGVAIPQTYQESGTFSNSNAAIPQDAPGIWDIALRIKSLTTNQLACFRAVKSDGAPLDGYDAWPAIYNN